MELSRLLMIDLSGPQLTAEEREFLASVRPGGVCLFGRNIVDRFQVAEFVDELRQVAGERLLVAVDQEGGGVVRLQDLPYPPSAMALGAADDPALTEEMAFATGRGLASVGINVDFAPVADVNSNAANPVIADRSFGADPQHVARHVAAFVKGLQRSGVAATPKHFPGHGDTSVDSHLALPHLARSLEELERLELLPFRAAMSAGAAGIMSAHIVVSGVDRNVPATLSPAAMTGLLRETLGFDGVVFSDALDMKAVAAHWEQGEAAVLAVASGVDVVLTLGPIQVHRKALASLEHAVADGTLTESRINRSLERIASLAGDFPGRVGDVAAASGADAREIMARTAARAQVVLGRLPVFAPGDGVVVVAASATRHSAATQTRVDAAGPLVAALREEGLDVDLVEYDPEQPKTCQAQALSKAAAAPATLFVSSGRVPAGSDVVDLGTAVATAAKRFAHLAIWNPYAARELPGPALVTFGWREASARAAAALLVGKLDRATGIPPIPLVTLDGMSTGEQGRGDHDEELT